MTTMSLCRLWSTFYRCRCGKTALFILLGMAWLIMPLGLYAHHESLAAPEREYLKLISLHPFKDTVIHNNDYDFYITVVESAPQAVDLIFYIENPLFKRPVHSSKEILLYNGSSQIPRKFILETDISGVSSLRYYYQKPFTGIIKMSAITSDRKTLSAEAVVQIGSPGPSYSFFIIFGLIIIGALGYVLVFRRTEHMT